MNATDLLDKIDWEGGIPATLEYGLPLSEIEDDQLRQAWSYLQEEWNRFEVHIKAFEAILNGKLASSSV